MSWAALALVFGAAMQTATGAPALLERYSAERANSMWGAQLFCSPRDSERVLRQVDRRLTAIRAALIGQFEKTAVERADTESEAQFRGDVETVGFGISCKRGDPAFDRCMLTALKRDYDRRLSSLEAALIDGSRGVSRQ